MYEVLVVKTVFTGISVVKLIFPLHFRIIIRDHIHMYSKKLKKKVITCIMKLKNSMYR